MTASDWIVEKSMRAVVLTLGILFATSLTADLALSDDEGPSTTCKKGYVYSPTKGRCVKKTSELLTDEDLYQQARALAKAGEYQRALDLLWRVKDQKQARVLNYIGYTNRKLGKVDEGISYYHKALAIDPNYNVAREYLGEGYLQKGDVDSAEAQLKKIRENCGSDCDAYRKLKKEIALYVAK